MRTYAATLINDREVYSGELRNLAASKGIAMPSKMEIGDRKRLDRLARTHGREFDTAFIQEIRRVNGLNIRLFRKAVSHVANSDIRRFVDRVLHIDEKHEAEALALTRHDIARSGY